MFSSNVFNIGLFLINKMPKDIMIKKIENKELSKKTSVIRGLFLILDGLISVLSFGYYYGEFAYNHTKKEITKLNKKTQCQK